jgi:serine/threonine protein kinase
MTEASSRRIGDYEILDELGSGGMGKVYRVRNVISDRIEAMKVLLPDLAGRQELAARFLREIKVLATLDHPNIAALRTALTLDNQLVMIMEYVEGTTLASRLERGAVAVPEALSYIDQVLSALSYAHQQHVIHRDIKPGNMMLTTHGIVKLMDFGLARSDEEGSPMNLTKTGTTLGSISYMSPEQVKGENTDERSDLYSVGISLYEIVTGRRPFQANSDYSIMTAHVTETPRPPIEFQPGLPAALNDIILTAIAKTPGMRFQSADAFRNALKSVGPFSKVTDPSQQVTRETATIDTAVIAAMPREATMAMSSPQVATPVPAAAKAPATPMPSPATQSGHRGLYMTLGAMVVLAVLVLAGIYWPGRSRAAGGASTPPPQPPPVATETPKPSQPQTEAPLPPVTAPETTEAKPEPTALKEPATVKHEKPMITTPNPTTQIDAAALEELDHQLDQLSNRAASVNSGLDRLQQQQASSGYGLRGDMAGRQASMNLALAKAQDAVGRKDSARAKKYVDQAESDVEALEKFLGR